jgi:malonate transporter and related proteins
MQTLFGVTLPFFVLVLCGWLAARSLILPASAIPGLNAFVLYFALPCMLFRFGMNTPIHTLLSPAVIGTWLACALLIVAFTIAITLSAQVGLKDAAFGALVAAFPNTGFMGVPLLLALLGEQAVGAAMSLILVDLIVTTSLCLAIAQSQGVGDQGPRAAVVRALRGVVSNPMPWAIAAGAVCSATGFKLAGPPLAVVSMLADAASPVALFTIGAVLWRAGQMQAASPSSSSPWGSVVPVTVIKLVVHPTLVFLMGHTLQRLGAPLSSYTVMVMTLVAALPSASNVSILAERFGADNGRIARIILATTCLAFVSFTGLAWLFGVQSKS